MTTPTPDEITAAVETLLRVPGVDRGQSLENIEAIASPVVQLAHRLRDWVIKSPMTPDLGHFASMIENLADQHGLRITTDPEPTPATGWTEPADWPIPGHAPGLYSMYSIGDGHGPAVITENGRLLIQQNDESGNDSEEWRDRTDLYKSARWPLTPVTVRTTGEPGKLLGYNEARNVGTRDWVVTNDRTWQPGALANAREHRTPGRHLVAVYLLPEGGQQ